MTDKNNQGLDAEYVFLVVKNRTGQITIANVDDADTDRQPRIDDIYSALSIIKRDLQANQMVGAVVQLLQQAGSPVESATAVPKPSDKFNKVKRVK